MPVRPTEALQDVLTDAVVDALDAGAAAGYVEVYTGIQPGSVEDDVPEDAELLATFTLNDPAFGASAAGVAAADLDPAVTATADASGYPRWYRAYDSDDGVVFDGTVGENLTVSPESIVDGATITLASFTVSSAGHAQVARLLTSRDSFA